MKGPLTWLSSARALARARWTLHKLEARLRHQADHDALTGLYNRRRLADELTDQLKRAARRGGSGALAIVDVDGFRFVNDSFGHAAGDDLLREVARALERGVRKTDVLARLGGDEFAILFSEIDARRAAAVTENLLEEIKHNTSPSIAGSAGVATFDGSQELTAEDLLISADIALYDAKQHGGDHAVSFSDRRGQALTWVQRIRQAIEDDQFCIYTQPIVELKTGAVSREEVLVRMRNDQGDIIPPAAFLPTAERFGLIGDIDRLVVDKALDLAKDGRAVAINLSSHSLGDAAITQRVGAAISAGLDPSLISFEVTETSALSNLRTAIEFGNRLERLGCELALDDFGTGFGSFTYLGHLPVQTINIDAEFVCDLHEGHSNYHLVRLLVELAKALGQATVAEGVDKPETLVVLRQLGVDHVQGYFLGEPRPAEADAWRDPPAEALAALSAPLHL
jgi:diguanylate cyclase (GGDEF)-like protein